ncbi:MAG TPA: FAD-dependent oxidoreductase [Gaiellaceae bacterium]|nr:FAD-dependent oxidoreductase [Gaiellaceae bacterium]
MTSFWIESSPATRFPVLEGDVRVDVAIVGGGLTGITAASLLKAAGKTVALVEMKRLARGATGYTTAKITSGHGLVYGHLTRKFGEDGARVYAEANEAALERIRALVEERGIDCDLETQPNYAYARSSESLPAVEEEAEAARRAGLAASLVRDLPLPYPVAGAVRLENQAQFHPRKYLLPLAEQLAGDGSYVFEETRALDVRLRPPVVETSRGSVHARDVVLATHLPFEDKGLFFAKTHPSRSYAVAGPVEEPPEGMFISVDQPTRSVRTAPHEGGRILIAGGEGHKTGQDGDTGARYRSLEDWAQEHFGVESVGFRWSTHDYVSVDRVPFVGPLVPGGDRVWVATGYGKWGMTNGTAAAIVLADGILGRANPWAAFFSSLRLRSLATRSLLTENADAARRLLGDRVALPGVDAAAALGAGEGAVIRVDGRKVAVSRGAGGELVAVSPTCTHMGCLVSWNLAERTWDCPCHGSRYLPDGTVIQGPAVRDLAPRELPAPGTP